MQKLKRLWIPAEILLNENLSDKEKIILSIILYLSEETKSCFASNKYIANIVNVTPERVSKIISSLKDKGYISVKLKYKTDSKEIEERQITPIVENINRYSQKLQEGIDNNNYLDSEKRPYPIGKNNKDIINNIKNKNNYNFCRFYMVHISFYLSGIPYYNYFYFLYYLLYLCYFYL